MKFRVPVTFLRPPQRSASALNLVQKFYLKLDKPNHYGGFYVWKSRDAMLAYRESELAKSIAAAYKSVGAPDVEIHEILFQLRDEGAFQPA
jgi:hypothetical protein